MRKLKSKIVLCAVIVFTMLISNMTVFAGENGNVKAKIYSPEYTNAYIQIHDIEKRNTSVGEVDATVFVEEIYDNVTGTCIDSKLLSKDEVERIGIESFKEGKAVKSSIYPGTTETYQQLQLTFTIPSQPATNKYNLRAYAKWSGGSGVSGPASGDDFIGFAWGGGFDYSGASISGRTTSNGSMSFYASDAVANAGKVWGFNENSPKMDYLNAYITLNKNTQTGGGNTTSFMTKYIHTYQSTVGSVSITAGATGVGSGFTLSSCSRQWSLVADLSGIRY